MKRLYQRVLISTGLKTASSIKTKVVGNPVRTPVNMQAVKVMMPAPWWAQPLPAEEDYSKRENVAKLLAKVEEIRLLLIDERRLGATHGRLIANLRDQLRVKSEELTTLRNLLKLKELTVSKAEDKLLKLSEENKALNQLLGGL